MERQASFLERLEARARSVDSLLCVGLDPHPDMLPEPGAGVAYDLCTRLIDATHDLACAFKPNSAFFEVYGGEGIEALRAVIAAVPEGIPVILDAKRGDIASSAEAYAAAAFDTLGADAITLSPYLGQDSVEPFLRRPEKGAFVLCRTSNPGAADLQDLFTLGALWKELYQSVAEIVMRWPHQDNLGLVVGATDPGAVARVRMAVPEAWFLVPGVGAQGGDLEATLRAGLRADGLGVLINASRSIARADDPRTEAERLRNAINAARRSARRESARPETAAPQPEHIRRLAWALYQAGCVRFGNFTLKSGSVSPIYLDLRRLVSAPDQMRIVAEVLITALGGLEFKHMAAIPYAALPIATVASFLSGRSLIYPRREAKDYGTKAAVEGIYEAGDDVVLIDDLATTGESKFEAIERLRAAGLVVRNVVVVIDREQGAAEALRAAGYGFRAVATLNQLLDVWEAQSVISPEQRAEVDEFLERQRRPGR